ncbi:MAG: biotin--[acetyl-CoA-carboxylase] ligase [Clostridiales bacterium]|nr:biotin--[acetyl-CoA-carboxylase] ligase [Clostridiales bacterium]
MKTKILQELKLNDGYTSGQQLSEACNVSRTAIWKVMNQLRDEGYDIQSVKNKGYRVAYTPDVLSRSEIASDMLVDYEIVYEEEVNSTNTYAKILAEQGCRDKTIVVAERQTQGKGRRGRSFDSPRGGGIWMTVILKPNISPNMASMLTIIAAMAVREGIENSTGLKCGIKWPNDIVCSGKKICGILTEMSSEMEYINYVIVGMGINVNIKEFSDDIKSVATSISLEMGEGSFKRSEMIAEVIGSFDKYYENFITQGNLSSVRKDYDRYLVNVGKQVSIEGNGEKYAAKAIGIADNGELIIERDGHPELVRSGEVSVRGIYGYV